MWFCSAVVNIFLPVWLVTALLVTSTSGDCTPPNCNGQGVCNSETNTCTCDEPYSGAGCEKRDPCKIVNHEGVFVDRDCSGDQGTCQPVPNKPTESHCICKEGYVGPRCHIPNLCIFNPDTEPWAPWAPGEPCHNGAECIFRLKPLSNGINFDVTVHCDCKTPYIGLACDYVDPCHQNETQPHPCYSRGKCNTITPPGQDGKPFAGVPYKQCRCDVGYDSGTFCERRDPCVNEDGRGSICKNGARCVIIRNDTHSSALCNCSRNYDGDFCERVNKCGIPAEECHAGSSKRDCNPCLNGGICTSTLAPVQTAGVDPDYKDKFYRTHSCDCSNVTYFGDYCQLLKTRVILIPRDHPGPPGITHVDSFEAISGRKHEYYLVAIAIGEEGEIHVDTGDGFHFQVTSMIMKPVPTDNPVLSELAQVKDQFGNPSATYYPFFYTYEQGDYDITLRILDGGSLSDQQITKVGVVLPDPSKCVPFSKLKNVGHTIDEATQYTRTDTFVVEVDLRFDCFESEWINENPNSTYKFRYEWKLYQLTHLFPSPGAENDWHADMLTKTNTKYLQLEPNVLIEGLYWVECRAYVEINGVEYGNSDKGFFRINLHAPKIILEGGHERTVDKSLEIILDASQSTDESYPEQSPYLKYNWLCLQPCDLGPWNGSVVRIPPDSFEVGSTVSIFLIVESAHTKTLASADIQLHISQGASISVQCIRNCDFLNPGDEVIFEVNYRTGENPGNDWEIQWIWLPRDEIFPIAVVDEPYQMSIILPQVQDISTRSLICNATRQGAFQITSRVDFKINMPPAGSNCKVVPESGVYLETEFLISCDPFEDTDLPIEYTFFAEIEGGDSNRLISKLESRLHLGHDTNPILAEVYLPFGSNSGAGVVRVVVVVTDDLGLSQDIILPVSIDLPSTDNIKTLFMEKVLDNNSLMRRRFLRGDYQGALQLQMLAAYGLEDPTIAGTMTKEDIEAALTLIQSQILSTPQFSFLANEQLIYSTHMMDHVEDRPDPIVLLNVTRAMYEAASKLVQYAKDGNEVTSSAELETLADAVADSGSRLLSAAVFCAKSQNEQANVLMKCNHRNVLDFDEADDNNPESYFDVIEDDLSTLEKQSIGTISESVSAHVGDCAKSGRNALRAMRGALEGAIGHLGVALSYSAVTEKVSTLTQIMSQVNTSVNVALETYDTTQDTIVNVTIPGDTLEILQNRIDTDTAKLELQMVTTTENAFIDDTSACPSTLTLHLKVQDSDSHVPVLVQKLESPIEITLPIIRPITEAELEAGKSVAQQVEILPVEDLDDYYQPPTFHVNLPYNSKIVVLFDDQSSTTMIFKMLALKGRRPVFSDFCQDETVTEVDSATRTAVFYTERIGLNEEPDEPFLDYHVSVLVFDFHNVHRLEQFSVVFTRYSCLYRDENQRSWLEKGCMTSNESTMSTALGGTPSPMHLSEMKCLCNHASVISGVQFVIPHTIDVSSLISGFSIDEIRKNPVVLITVSILLAAYLIAMIVCRLFDARDSKEDVGLTIMADLTVKSERTTFYLITVVTGCNFWAGTTASVGLIIYGSNGRSKVFTLKDRTNTVFLRGDVDTFLVSCDKDLGELEKIRLWTNHTGVDPSWYCRKILIRCVSPSKHWYFYVNQWITVTAEESHAIVEVSATTSEERKKFSVRLKENMLEQIDNVNLWISIFRYSPASPFTRCQRLSCAFAVLTSYLFIDILFLGTPTEDEDGLFDFGEYTFDIYAFIKGIQVVILALPFGFILITLFRSIRLRYNPTLIIWENVIPATTTLKNKNLFIPSKEEKRSRWKKVQFPREDPNHNVFQFDTDQESMPDDDTGIPRRSSRPEKGDQISAASTASAFSIPSTDVPKLEDWIQDKVNEDKDAISGAESDDPLNDPDEVGHDFTSPRGSNAGPYPFIRSVDSTHTIGGQQQNDTMFRLGRRAMLSSVRDHNPDTFIFAGDNDISRVEEMIDEQLLQNRAKHDRKKKRDTGDNLDTSQDEEQGKKEIVLTPKEDDGHHLFKKVKAPWKKSVTTKYLEDIDQALEMEMENTQHLQDKSYWESQTALEMCQVSVDFNRRHYASLPWWFVYVAWLICLSTIILCAFLTILYGIHYGYLRSLKWLETLLASFLISVFVVQPTNAFAFAIIGTLLGQSQKVKERLQARIEDVASTASYLSNRLPYKFQLFSPIQPCEPLRGNQIFRLTIQARRRKELHGKLVRLILCVILLIPLIAVSYSGHNEYNYGVTRNIRNIFQLNEVRGEKVKFRGEASVFDYLEKVVVYNLHPTRLYNNQPVPVNGPALLSDQQTLLIGVARVRQQRVKATPCPAIVESKQGFSLPTRKTCNVEFKSDTQDRESYDPVWEPVGTNGEDERLPSSLTNDGWEFHSANSPNTESLTFRGYQGTYDGGGYILELGRNRRQSLSVVKYMQKSRWLDHRSRGIFVEMTLMNPNINKFVDMVLLIEQGPTGSFSLTSWISPIELIPIDDLQTSDEVAWVSISMIAIIVILFIWVVIVINEMMHSSKSHRFRNTGFWLDVIIISLVFISLCVSLVRFIIANEFADAIQTTKEDDYVSIQRAAYWTDAQRSMFSVTQAVVFIKFWKLLMFTDKRFLTFALTLKLTANFMIAFVFVLIVLLCAFATFGFVLFGQNFLEFSTWGESMVTLVDHYLGASFFHDFVTINPVLGPAFTFLYGYFFLFIGLNLVVALLDLGVHEAKEVVQQRRVWLTYFQYFKETLLKSLPFINAKTKQILGDQLLLKGGRSTTVHPDRWQGMKRLTARFIRDFLVDAKVDKMKEMQKYCNKRLAGTRFRMVGKKQKAKEKELEKQQHIEQLRKTTAIYIREKLGHDMKAKEFKEYADINRYIVKLRIQKMEEMLARLEEKIDQVLHHM